jgi:hypothetical protein
VDRYTLRLNISYRENAAHYALKDLMLEAVLLALGRRDDWGTYIGKLKASGHFQGGSAIGAGFCARKSGAVPTITGHLSGFIRVTASGKDDARKLLIGNPVFEAGGTVEIRELRQTE